MTVMRMASRCRRLSIVTLVVAAGACATFSIPPRYVDLMRRSGCDVVFFRPPFTSLFVGQANNRNHRRILVVDGRVGFTGGAGVSREWMGDGRLAGHWRDTE